MAWLQVELVVSEAVDKDEEEEGDGDVHEDGGPEVEDIALGGRRFPGEGLEPVAEDELLFKDGGQDEDGGRVEAGQDGHCE